MNTTFMEVAAHSLGNFRIGRRPLPGQGRLVDGIGRVANLLAGDKIVTSPWPGVRFETDLTDRIQRQMWAGTYEPHVRTCFNALLDPGDVYIDVGGHIGYHAVAAAHKVGANGRVFAFEADPIMFQRLAGNLNQFPWSLATHAAVWDRSGTLTFERSSVAEESGWGTLTEVRDSGQGEHLEVSAISLDEWFRDQHLTRWDVMKLDAEGAELAVLQGAESALKQFRPSMMIEINGNLLTQSKNSPAQVVNFLTAHGYRLFALSFGRLDTWEHAKHGDFSDTLCLPEDRLNILLDRLTKAGFDHEG